MIKRYHAPATPAARLLESAAISPKIKAHLKDIAEKLDPLRLLDEIRAMQHHLAAVAKGERMHTPKPRPPRTWRSRIDPFEKVWPQINGWLEDEPDQTGVELLARLQQTHPGRFPDGQLRTLQRRLADWRLAAAHRLVFRDLHPQPAP